MQTAGFNLPEMLEARVLLSFRTLAVPTIEVKFFVRGMRVLGASFAMPLIMPLLATPMHIWIHTSLLGYPAKNIRGFDLQSKELLPNAVHGPARPAGGHVD